MEITKTVVLNIIVCCVSIFIFGTQYIFDVMMSTVAIVRPWLDDRVLLNGNVIHFVLAQFYPNNAIRQSL